MRDDRDREPPRLLTLAGHTPRTRLSSRTIMLRGGRTFVYIAGVKRSSAPAAVMLHAPVLGRTYNVKRRP